MVWYIINPGVASYLEKNKYVVEGTPLYTVLEDKLFHFMISKTLTLYAEAMDIRVSESSTV